MKKLIFAFTSLAMAGTASAVFVLVPNGDFSTAAGADWNQAGSGGTVISYPASGGNGGGFGQIDNTAGSWGVLVSEATGPNPAVGNGIPLGSLGLIAGGTYTFSWDQIDLGPAASGDVGIKLESWTDVGIISNSGDQYRALTSSWKNESYTYTIEPTATRVKVVMVNVAGQEVAGFDNIGVENNIPEPASAMMIALGGAAFMLRRRRRR